MAWLDTVARDDQFASAITVGELFVGAYRAAARGRHLARIEDRVLPAVTVLPLDTSVAQIYGRLAAALADQGTRLADADLLIAATALRHDLDLVTGNLRHFGRIPELRTRRARHWAPATRRDAVLRPRRATREPRSRARARRRARGRGTPAAPGRRTVTIVDRRAALRGQHRVAAARGGQGLARRRPLERHAPRPAVALERATDTSCGHAPANGRSRGAPTASPAPPGSRTWTSRLRPRPSTVGGAAAPTCPHAPKQPNAVAQRG
jgi:tRNA(fMet)-specific endonuclease VapC